MLEACRFCITCNVTRVFEYVSGRLTGKAAQRYLLQHYLHSAFLEVCSRPSSGADFSGIQFRSTIVWVAQSRDARLVDLV